MYAKEFLNYKQCLQLAKLNYDGDYDFVYHATGELWERGKKDKKERFLPAPLKQQVLRWFREKYGLIGEIFSQLRPSNKFMFAFKIGGSDIIFDGFDTYEEAENNAIDKLIEVAKQQEK